MIEAHYSKWITSGLEELTRQAIVPLVPPRVGRQRDRAEGRRVMGDWRANGEQMRALMRDLRDLFGSLDELRDIASDSSRLAAHLQSGRRSILMRWPS